MCIKWKMNLDFFSFVKLLWQQQPSIIILFCAGLIVFSLLVVDCSCFCRARKARTRARARRALREFRSQLRPLARGPHLVNGLVPKPWTKPSRGERGLEEQAVAVGASSEG